MRSLIFAIILFAGLPILSMEIVLLDENTLELDEYASNSFSDDEEGGLTVGQAIEILQNSRYEKFSESFFLLLFFWPSF